MHKQRNLLAHAPERLHEEISADYKDMIYAGTKQENADVVRQAHREGLHEEFKRRIKTQTVLPPEGAETAAMFSWHCSLQSKSTMHKVDGGRSLGETPFDRIIDLDA